MQRLARGASVVFAGRMLGRALYVLTQILLARALGPALFGLYALGWAILRLVGVFAPLGLDHGVIRFGSRFGNTLSAGVRTTIAQAFLWSTVSGTLLGAALYASAPWLSAQFIPEGDGAYVLRILAVAVPAVVVLRVAAATTQIFQEMRFAVLAEDLAQPALQLALQVVAFAMGWGLAGALWAIVASFGISALLGLRFVRHLVHEGAEAPRARFAAGFRPDRQLLVFSMFAAFSGLANIAISLVDRLFLGYFRSAVEVGVFQAAAQSSIVFGLVLSAFNAIFAPMIAREYHLQRMAQLEELYRVSTKWTLTLSIPIVLLLVFAPAEVLTFAFGAEYAAGALPLLILTAAQVVNIGTGAVGLLLLMTGRQRSWLALTAGALALDLVLNWILVPRYGADGAALSTAAAICAMFVSGLWVVRKSLGIWPYDRRFVKPLLAAGAGAGAIVLAQTLLAPATAGRAVLLTGFAGTVGFAAVLFLMGLDGEDRQILAPLLARLRARAAT